MFDISSNPGYLLVTSLGQRDESLMKNIVKTIEPYGFNSLLVNFAIHKSSKVHIILPNLMLKKCWIKFVMTW